jgi:hypothetical protein
MSCSKLKEIAIIGAGGFGREVRWLIERINRWQESYENPARPTAR